MLQQCLSLENRFLVFFIHTSKNWHLGKLYVWCCC